MRKKEATAMERMRGKKEEEEAAERIREKKKKEIQRREK